MIQQLAMDQSCHMENDFVVPSPMACSSASRILSRYRPIAPKPLMPKVDADPKFMSAVTFQLHNKTLKFNTSQQKRSRKRDLATIMPSENCKRKSLKNGSGSRHSCSLLFPVKIEDNYICKCGCTYVQARSVTGSRAPSSSVSCGIQPAVFSSHELCKRRATVDAEAIAPKFTHSLSRDNAIESIPISVDGAFMQRAARMSTFLDKPAEESRLHKEPPVPALSTSVSCSPIHNLKSTTGSAYRQENLQKPLAEGSDTTISPHVSTRSDLVTLALLPDTPLHEPRSSAKSHHKDTEKKALKGSSSDEMIQLSLFSSSQHKHSEKKEAKSCVVPLFGEKSDPDDVEASVDLPFGERSSRNEWRVGERTPENVENLAVRKRSLAPVLEAGAVGSFHEVWAQFISNRSISSPVIDSSYLERFYMTSSDPVLLTDEHYRVLWFNSSFKAISEKLSKKLVDKLAYIDDLGVPTSLACFTFLGSGSPASRCKAVLWGFLKKMVFFKLYEMQTEPLGLAAAPLMIQNVDSHA